MFSLDTWQRHRIEGYGYCQLSDIPGTTCVEIDMWRPRGESRSDEVRRFFIGGLLLFLLLVLFLEVLLFVYIYISVY